MLLVLSSKPLTCYVYSTLIILYIRMCRYISSDSTSPQLSENTPTCLAFPCSVNPSAAGFPLDLSSGTLFFQDGILLYYINAH